MNYRIIRLMVLLLAVKCLTVEAFRGGMAQGGINNFQEFQLAANRLNNHEPLYIPEQGPKLLNQFVSSPLVPMLLRPLARLPARTGFSVWTAMETGALLLAIGLYIWGTGLRILDDAVAVLLILFTGYRYWPSVLELGMGNTDLFLLVAVCGMYVCDRYGKWMWLALLVALAALTKTWMLGVLFYLLARRQWLAAIAGCAFFGAGLAIMFYLIGWKEFPQWIAITHRYSSQPLNVSHSVAGMTRIFFSANPLTTPLVNSAAVHLAALAAGYGYLVCGLFCLWWRGPEMNAYQARLCLGLTPLALVLGNTLSHQYYLVLALPLLWTLLVGSADSSPGWGVRLAAFALYLVLSIPSPGDPLPEALKHGPKMLEVATSFGSGMLLFGLGVCVVMREFPADAGKPVPVAGLPEADVAA